MVGKQLCDNSLCNVDLQTVKLCGDCNTKFFEAQAKIILQSF